MAKKYSQLMAPRPPMVGADDINPKYQARLRRHRLPTRFSPKTLPASFRAAFLWALNYREKDGMLCLWPAP
jgi:hypothetical protein